MTAKVLKKTIGRSSDDLFPSLAGRGPIALDCETRDPEIKTRGPGYHRPGCYVAGVAVAAAGFARYYPVAHESGENLDKQKVFAWLRRELGRPSQEKVFANSIYDLGFLAKEGVRVAGPIRDVQVAEPLLDENKLSYSLERILRDYGHEGKYDEEMDAYLVQHFGKKNPKGNIWRAPPEVVGPYALGDAVPLLDIYAKQRKLLEAQDLWELFEMESKLLPMLLAMRQRGVRVDLARAEEARSKFVKQKNRVEEEIRRLVGAGVEIWAAKSISAAFDRMGLSYPLTPKTKVASFTKSFLADHPHRVSQMIVEARRLDKMIGTFLEGSILESHIGGRVYAQFHSMKSDDGGTVTGRFSCAAWWTPVATQRGEVQIRDILVGDKVWTHRQRWRTVTATHVKGCERMLSVYLSNGRTLTCTRNHRLLLASGRWITVGDLRERIEALGLGPEEYRGRPEVDPATRYAHEGHREEVKDTVAQCVGCSDRAPVTRGEEGPDYASPLLSKDAVESDARKVWQSAPQLQRSMRRQERLQNDQASGGKTHLTSQLRDLQDIWDQETSPRLDDSSHRHERGEQRPEQLSSRDDKRARDNPFALQGRSGLVKVKKIENSRDLEVYDITVEEDESYESCSVYSHNSSNPNLQFIPVRTADGKLIRSMFLPDAGQRWWKTDQSQVEFRLLVHDAVCARLPGASEIANRFRCDPTTDYHDEIAEMAELERGPAKTVNFGLAYGEGKDKLAVQLGLSIDDAEELLRKYHRKVPFMRPLINLFMNMAKTNGELRTLMNRKRRFDTWELTKWGKGKRESIYSKEQRRGWQRAFTYKALNARIQGSAADVMKKSMVDVWESGVCDVIGVPQLTVHDELDGSYPDTKLGREAVRESAAIQERCVKLTLPLKVDLSLGGNWGDLEDLSDGVPAARNPSNNLGGKRPSRRSVR